MSEPSEVRYDDYDDFAGTYNAHWGGFAARVLEPLDTLVLGSLAAGSHIVDLCCGTGQLASRLTAAGYRVTGIDGSERMIDIARRNAPGAEFIVADARSFLLQDPAACVLSTFDSLNHIMAIEELEAAFGCVVATLEPGGRFVFDLNMEAGYLERWTGTLSIVEDDEVVLAISSYDPAARVGQTRLTMFRRLDDDAMWNRRDLTLTQRCYPEADVVAALGRTGFAQVEVRDAASVDESWQSGRSFFVATREASAR